MELLRLRMPRNLHTVLPTVVEFLLVDRQHLRRLYFLLCALTSRRRGDSPFMRLIYWPPSPLNRVLAHLLAIRLIYWPPVHCVASWSPPSPLHRIMEFLV